MRRRLTVIMTPALATILAVGLVTTGCPNIPEGATVGQRAPDFQLRDLSGQTVTLSEQRGLPLLINFWGSWCGYCILEMPYLQAIEDKYHRKLTILAINVGDNLDTAVGFMESNNLTFTALLDTTRKVSQQYSITGYPTTFFIDKDGIIQDKVIGPFSSQSQIESRLSQILP